MTRIESWGDLLAQVGLLDQAKRVNLSLVWAELEGNIPLITAVVLWGVFKDNLSQMNFFAIASSGLEDGKKSLDGAGLYINGFKFVEEVRRTFRDNGYQVPAGITTAERETTKGLVAIGLQTIGVSGQILERDDQWRVASEGTRYGVEGGRDYRNGEVVDAVYVKMAGDDIEKVVVERRYQPGGEGGLGAKVHLWGEPGEKLRCVVELGAKTKVEFVISNGKPDFKTEDGNVVEVKRVVVRYFEDVQDITPQGLAVMAWSDAFWGGILSL